MGGRQRRDRPPAIEKAKSEVSAILRRTIIIVIIIVISILAIFDISAELLEKARGWGQVGNDNNNDNNDNTNINKQLIILTITITNLHWRRREAGDKGAGPLSTAQGGGGIKCHNPDLLGFGFNNTWLLRGSWGVLFLLCLLLLAERFWRLGQ